LGFRINDDIESSRDNSYAAFCVYRPLGVLPLFVLGLFCIYSLLLNNKLKKTFFYFVLSSIYTIFADKNEIE